MYHQLEQTETGFQCMACGATAIEKYPLAYQDCEAVAEYPWFDQMPDNLKTKTMLKALRMKPGKDIALFGGGDLFRSLLQVNLVDRVEVSLIPILLGEGIPFLPPPAPQTRLRLLEQRLYKKTGIVGLQYEVIRT